MGAKLIERAGFDCAYLSGFAVSATRLAVPVRVPASHRDRAPRLYASRPCRVPLCSRLGGCSRSSHARGLTTNERRQDVGLATYNDMVEAARACCDAVSIPVVGDGDTGYGGVLNVRRTVHGYARAGVAAISIEDQTFPKRCSYAQGVQIAPRADAIERVRAAIKARDEIRATHGLDILIIGRTDCARARPPAGGTRQDVLDEALARCLAFQASPCQCISNAGTLRAHTPTINFIRAYASKIRQNILHFGRWNHGHLSSVCVS